jgi:hypothetical protein
VGNNGGWNEDGTPRRMDIFSTDRNGSFEGSELINYDNEDFSSPQKMLKSDFQNDIPSGTRKSMLPPLA